MAEGSSMRNGSLTIQEDLVTYGHDNQENKVMETQVGE